LEHVKLWAADQHGGWDLICQYWVCDSPQGTSNGLKFNAPFHSQIVEQLLPTVLEDQDTFSDLEDQNRDGLIQIHSPSEEDSRAAYSALQTALADRSHKASECIDNQATQQVPKQT
jgi:hypothetical protein